ncbi:hypothetical protein T459_25770 [Capsicum annuum]|uniref:Ubiquitin-like protease family profile domain-containing protein n=1 Tax=Capsicum annuum TaxID=4072 RepID=A0A2G2YLP9_CAPAN|nr:hypothetical protein T459_25770 [Capsicum annuum]
MVLKLVKRAGMENLGIRHSMVTLWGDRFVGVGWQEVIVKVSDVGGSEEGLKMIKDMVIDVLILSDGISKNVKELDDFIYPSPIHSGRIKEGGDCGVFVIGYAEYLREGIVVPLVDFEAEYHRMRYMSLLRNYGLQKVKKCHVSDNDDPPRSRTKFVPITDETKIVSIE